MPCDTNGQKGIFGKMLKNVENLLPLFDEFKDRNITVIDNVEVVNKEVTISKEGIRFDSTTEPELVTIKYDENINWGDKISLYSLFLQNDEVFIRCTRDSITFKKSFSIFNI